MDESNFPYPRWIFDSIHCEWYFEDLRERPERPILGGIDTKWLPPGEDVPNSNWEAQEMCKRLQCKYLVLRVTPKSIEYFNSVRNVFSAIE